MNVAIRRAVSLAVLMLASGLVSVPAAEISPVGTWMAMDLQTGKPGALIAISEQSGQLTGRIAKVLNPRVPNPVCSHCQGAMHNQPLSGLELIWDLKKTGDGWSGGSLLDPQTGLVYKVDVAVVDDGSRLDVRGYLGLPALGRTVEWTRVSEAAGGP